MWDLALHKAMGLSHQKFIFIGLKYNATYYSRSPWSVIIYLPITTNLPLLEPNLSVVFYLTWTGSYENQYFGINVRTYIFCWISYQRTKKCVLFPSLKVQGLTVC